MSETGVAAIDRNTGATTSNATVTVIAANSVEGDGNVIGENIVMPPTPREGKFERHASTIMKADGNSP